MFEVLSMRRGMGKNLINVFQNMKRFETRKCITEQLAALGLLRGKQDHAMRVPFCSRSGDVVELLLKPQW
jgi:valyl-tRNA synthetase